MAKEASEVYAVLYDGMDEIRGSLDYFQQSADLFGRSDHERLKTHLVQGYKHIVSFSIAAMKLSAGNYTIAGESHPISCV